MFFQFYTEAAEVEAWLNDKRPLLASTEIGKDEDSTQTLQRKLEALSCEIEAFQTTISRLASLAQNIAERQHFDTDNVQMKQVSFASILYNHYYYYICF